VAVPAAVPCRNSRRLTNPDPSNLKEYAETADHRGRVIGGLFISIVSGACLRSPLRSSPTDVVIVGAGAAGLSALEELDRAGCKVICIEARERIGGRILTFRDAFSPVRVELGAEFIHGRPPEIWDILHSGRLAAYDCAENAVYIENGAVQHHGDAWALVGRVMDDMQRRAAKHKDRSFSSFLDESKHPENAKRLAAAYVEGFNAARKEVIGIASLAEDARAADQIDGNRSFRLLNGYDSLMLHLLDGVNDAQRKLRLNSIVKNIHWKRGSARVEICSALTGNLETVRSRRVVITVALGVLQADTNAAGAIGFHPEPESTLRAARELRFGQVIRIVLRFREAFWEDTDEISDAGFLLSNEKFFPTWWTTLPVRVPILTGWSAGPHADGLLDQPLAEILIHAIADLARITGSTPDKLNSLLEATYFHDWHGDPFARGAYSYVPASAMNARKTLAEPVERTLYFAGEATELNGHSATVHGAIATGKRVARQILEGL